MDDDAKRQAIGELAAQSKAIFMALNIDYELRCFNRCLREAESFLRGNEAVPGITDAQSYIKAGRDRLERVIAVWDALDGDYQDFTPPMSLVERYEKAHLVTDDLVNQFKMNAPREVLDEKITALSELFGEI